MSENLYEADAVDSTANGRRLSAILISPKFRLGFAASLTFLIVFGAMMMLGKFMEIFKLQEVLVTDVADLFGYSTSVSQLSFWPFVFMGAISFFVLLVIATLLRMLGRPRSNR